MKFKINQRVKIRPLEKLRAGFGTIVDILKSDTIHNETVIKRYYVTPPNGHSWPLNSQVDRLIIKRDDGKPNSFLIMPVCKRTEGLLTIL